MVFSRLSCKRTNALLNWPFLESWLIITFNLSSPPQPPQRRQLQEEENDDDDDDDDDDGSYDKQERKVPLKAFQGKPSDLGLLSLAAPFIRQLCGQEQLRPWYPGEMPGIPQLSLVSKNTLNDPIQMSHFWNPYDRLGYSQYTLQKRQTFQFI